VEKHKNIFQNGVSYFIYPFTIGVTVQFNDLV